MAGFRNEGFSGRVAEVDSSNNLKVNTSSALSLIGTTAAATINSDGSVGASKLVRAAEVSVNKRFRVGLDSLFFHDTFQYTSQFTGVWSVETSQSVTWGTSGYAFLNSASTTGATYALMDTYKMFPLINGSGLSIEFDALIPQATDATTKIEMGWFSAAGNSTPTDGVLFRVTSNSVYGVINFNGVETSINLGYIPDTNEHEYLLRVEQEEAQFWIDGYLYGTIPTIGTVYGQPSMSTYQPLAIRTIGTSTTVASLKIGAVRCFMRDIQAVRSWAQTMAGLGLMGSQGYGGTTQGTTALFTNNQAAGTGVVLSNTTAGGTLNGLGGHFDFQPTLAANNDGILCYYQVPAGNITGGGKSLVITGVRVQSCVSTTLALAAPMILSYSLAYGATALTLAQAEGATTKAYRRVPLGIEQYLTVNAPQGTLGSNGLVYTPASPIVVNAGEYVTIAVKNLGTVTTGGVVTAIVSFDSHWE